MKKLVVIHNLDEWSRIKNEAVDNYELIVFKHSPYCGTSSLCERIVDKWFADIDENRNIICVKINVVASKNISSFIAHEYNIRHESPQIIWINSKGSVKLHKSHFITEELLNK